MSDAEQSTNPQIEHSDDGDGLETEQQKIDRIAGNMAGKAGRVQGKHESSINNGPVSPGGGGIFSK